MTIDIQNAKAVQLGDIITNTDKLLEMLKNDEFEAMITFQGGGETKGALFSERYVGGYAEEMPKMFNIDRSYKNWSVDNPYPADFHFEWYLTEQGLIIAVTDGGYYYDRYFMEYSKISDITSDYLYDLIDRERHEFDSSNAQ